MVIRDACPRCQSSKYTKNGHIHNGKQNHQCQDCGRQFVECLEQSRISDDTRALIERLLVERISLRGICRAVGVHLKWLLGFLVQCIKTLPDHLHVQLVTCHGDVMIQRLAVEADEMSSFVHQKANKQWIWIAMDDETRQVLAFHVGDRSRKSAKRLWAKIPQAYRQHAMFVRPELSCEPKELLYRQVYCSFQHDESAPAAMSAMGYRNVLWGSDYPHLEGTFGHSQKTLHELFDDVSPEVRERTESEPRRRRALRHRREPGDDGSVRRPRPGRSRSPRQSGCR